MLVLAAIPFALIGAGFLVAPDPLARLAGIELTSATAIADIRAVYGGLQIACAATLVGASRRREWWAPGLAFQSLVYGALFLSRTYSYLVSGWPDALGGCLHAGETIGLMAAVALLLPALRRRGTARDA